MVGVNQADGFDLSSRQARIAVGPGAQQQGRAAQQGDRRQIGLRVVGGGALEQASVDENGWLTGRIDENGYETTYGYDQMGRVNRIVYPQGKR